MIRGPLLSIAFIVYAPLTRVVLARSGGPPFTERYAVCFAKSTRFTSITNDFCLSAERVQVYSIALAATAERAKIAELKIIARTRLTPICVRYLARYPALRNASSAIPDYSRSIT